MASLCFNKRSKNWVSVDPSLTGNKKYNSSEWSLIFSKLLINLGMNRSTELSVCPSTNLQFNDDSLYEYSGFIKLLNSKLEFLELPSQLARRIRQINLIYDFNLDLKYLNNEIIILWKITHAYQLYLCAFY